jgi:hypothetical protein
MIQLVCPPVTKISMHTGLHPAQKASETKSLPLRLTAKATIAPTAETAETGIMGMTVSGKMREIIGNAF